MAGAADIDVARGLFFSHTMLALDAAIEGQGVALAPPPLAERELARGALEIVDPRSFVPGTGIYLAWPRKGLRTLSPAATAFRDWVIEEARATRPLVAARQARATRVRRQGAVVRRPASRGSSSRWRPERSGPLPSRAPTGSLIRMNDQGYLRHPALRGDTLVFVCDDDLWSVDADGGIARRLTAGLGEPATPCLRPTASGSRSSSRDEQHPEVYLMPAEGGSARRMTWLGPDVMVRGFTREGHILFVTTHGQPFFRNYRAHHARSRGRHAEAAAARAGESSRVRSRQGDGDRPQHRRSRALEALSRRHRRAPVDRRRRAAASSAA